MKDIQIKISRETRMVDVSKSFLGNDAENLQGSLVFTFKDEFVKGTARLEFNIEGEKQYAMLEKIGESYTLPIKSVLTKEGHIEMQLVITEGTSDDEIPIFKSNVFYVYVNKSINAEIEAEEGYPQWIEVANTKLNQIDDAIERAGNVDLEVSKENNIATVLITKQDGSQQSVEIFDGAPGEPGEPGVPGEPGKPGESGVYIGETEPTGDENVWIDTDGLPDKFDASEVVFTDGKDLQYKLDNGELGGGGGGTGTTNYNYLSNKPKINNVELRGELTLSFLGIQPTISDLETIRDGASKGSTAIQVNGTYSDETKEAIQRTIGILSSEGVGF